MLNINEKNDVFAIYDEEMENAMESVKEEENKQAIRKLYEDYLEKVRELAALSIAINEKVDEICDDDEELPDNLQEAYDEVACMYEHCIASEHYLVRGLK